MKRYTCTVSDRRGHKGDCMRQDKQGRYVEHSDADRLLKHVRRECDARLAKASREKAELVAALEEAAETIGTETHAWKDAERYLAIIARAKGSES
ncbi:MAG: hypothetical protein ACRCUB_15515 [Plesiomonas shigelloides]